MIKCDTFHVTFVCCRLQVFYVAPTCSTAHVQHLVRIMSYSPVASCSSVGVQLRLCGNLGTSENLHSEPVTGLATECKILGRRQPNILPPLVLPMEPLYSRYVHPSTVVQNEMSVLVGCYGSCGFSTSHRTSMMVYEVKPGKVTENST